MRKETNRGETWLVRCSFAAVMLLLLGRCFFSVNYGNEPYCISSVWRFYQGDALIAQDWFPAQQLVSWLLFPFYALFRIFHDSNDGILLASRIFYVLSQGIVAWIIYRRMKSYGNYRIAAVLLYLLATQNNMLTLNYNTIGISCMTLILTILVTEEKYEKKTLFFTGILTAVAILSQPYAMLLFLLWALIVLFMLPFVKKFDIHPLLRFRTLFFVGLGAFGVLMLFIGILFARADLAEIKQGIIYILNDPEHQVDIQYKVSKYFERFYRYYRCQILVMFTSLIVGILPKECKITKNMKRLVFLGAAGAAVYTVVYHGIISDYVPIDFVCVPISFLGISIWMLGKKKNKKLFFAWMIPAFAYTFCVQLSTNTGILAVTSACIVASVGGALLIGREMENGIEWIPEKFWKISKKLLIVVFALQMVILFYHRMTAVWWGAPVNECTERLEAGPAKGIFTSEEDAEEYYAKLYRIDQLHLKKEDQILFLDLDPMMYLYADLPVASYSTWTISEVNFLPQYYELYPEKLPTIICWLDAETMKDAVNSSYFIEMGYEPEEKKEGITLRKAR